MEIRFAEMEHVRAELENSNGNLNSIWKVLRVDVYKNQTRVGHSSKIDFAQILSRCSLLCL